MIRIVVADDHPLIREGIKHLLEDLEDIQVVGEAVNGQEVIQHVRNLDFDILLLDLYMPGRSGIELIKQVKQENSQIAILVLTMYDEQQYAVRCIRAGALGYLSKSTSVSSQLVTAIRRVADKKPFISPEVAEQLAYDIMPDTQKDRHKTLSAREFEIFKLLANGNSITNIAEQLHLSVKTVSTHKSRIMDKMAFKSLAEIVHYAILHNLFDKI